MRYKRFVIAVFLVFLALTSIGCKSDVQTLDDLYHGNMAKRDI